MTNTNSYTEAQKDAVTSFAQKYGYDSVKYLFPFKRFFVFLACEDKKSTGNPVFLLVDKDNNVIPGVDYFDELIDLTGTM